MSPLGVSSPVRRRRAVVRWNALVGARIALPGHLRRQSDKPRVGDGALVQSPARDRQSPHSGRTATPPQLPPPLPKTRGLPTRARLNSCLIARLCWAGATARPLSPAFLYSQYAKMIPMMAGTTMRSDPMKSASRSSDMCQGGEGLQPSGEHGRRVGADDRPTRVR